MSNSFFVNADFKQSFRELGLTSIEAVFAFRGDKNLSKDNLAGFRDRVQFYNKSPATTLFLKRYKKPPTFVQLKNWLSHHNRKSCGLSEFEQIKNLSQAGINTPKVVSYGQQWGFIFEKRSYIITENISNAESLERKLPDFFNDSAQSENLKSRRSFINKLADFVRKFHQTGYRHRDFYFSHIFYSDNGAFYLIDLARAFKPVILRRRFQIKDISQLYYSAPARHFSNTDRLRFYLKYTGRDILTNDDKAFIRKVVNKAKQMAKHNIKYKRPVPFAHRQQ